MAKPALHIPKINISEIHNSLVEKEFRELQEQFDISESYEPSDMELIPYSSIEENVDRSIDLCIEELTYISEKDCHANPEDLYVEK